MFPEPNDRSAVWPYVGLVALGAFIIGMTYWLAQKYGEFVPVRGGTVSPAQGYTAGGLLVAIGVLAYLATRRTSK